MSDLIKSYKIYEVIKKNLKVWIEISSQIKRKEMRMRYLTHFFGS